MGEYADEEWLDEDCEPYEEKLSELQRWVVDAATKQTWAIPPPKSSHPKMPPENPNGVLEHPTPSAAMLEKFAKLAMRELEAAELTSFILLKDEQLRNWWQHVLAEDEAIRVKAEAAEHKRQLIEQALSKLSDEEKGALGIKIKPRKA